MKLAFGRPATVAHPPHRSWLPGRAFSLGIGATAALGLVATLACLLAPSYARAGAIHPFKETFGSAAQPSFTNPSSIAVDRSSGDLLVVDAGAQTLSRFKPNGEPDPFSALGTNVIDAKKGPGGKVCAEEPASCDVPTPPAAEGFLFGSPSNVQVAVDNSGPASPTNGNIYVTQASRKVVTIFASDGHYLGQLTGYQGPINEVQKFKQPTVPFYLEIEGFQATGAIPVEPKQTGAAVCNVLNQKLIEVVPPGPNCTGSGLAGAAEKTITFNGGLANTNVPTMKVRRVSDGSLIEEATVVTQGGPGPIAFAEIAGVSVDSDGSVFVAEISAPGRIHKYVPTANPPVNGDFLTSFVLPTGVTPRGLAAGTGPTAGRLFAAENNGSVLNFDAASGEFRAAVIASGPMPRPVPTVAVDPSTGHLFAGFGDIVREYDASGPGEGIEIATLDADSSVQGVAVADGSGDVYLTRAAHPQLDVFGPSIRTPTVTTSAASEVGATDATLNGTVNSEGTAIVDCVFEYGETASYGFTAPCQGGIPNDGKPHPVSAELSGLDPEQIYHFRLTATNGAAPEVSTPADRTFTTGSPAITKAATSIADTSAVLNGTINPVGQQLLECKFEYGPTLAYGSTVPCAPAAGSIEPDFQDHPVSAVLTGLSKNQTYHFRLVGTNASGSLEGDDLTFSTVGPPVITDLVPQMVSQTAATIQAKVDPRGAPTSYRFEWGVAGFYGHSIPANFEASAGNGSGPVVVQAQLSGLQEASRYQFRLVARNPSGVTTSAGQAFETLNRCGLIQGRCFERVTPAAKGLVAKPGTAPNGGSGMFSQVGPAGGSLAYLAENGFADATAAEETFYLARRSASGWTSTQVSPPWPERSERRGESGVGGLVFAMSSDLRCGIVESPVKLTPDAPMAVVEDGGANLYRRDNDTGTYRVITTLTPVNAESVPPNGAEYSILGVSENCNRVVFRSPYRYPGISKATNQQELYEWNNGTIRNLGVIPGPGGASEPVITEVAPGTFSTTGTSLISGASLNYWRSVSADASRTIFTARSLTGGDLGNPAVFQRVGEAPAIDVSQSETATPNNGASRYWMASADGRRIFFTARYGLAKNGSSSGAAVCSNLSEGGGAGCDLYEYDSAKPAGERLTDLSVDTGDPEGAGVVGVLAASDDGTYVYFAARGRLVPEQGRSGAANKAAGEFNVYVSHEGTLGYVGAISNKDASDLSGGTALTKTGTNWTSQASPDGRHLLFESAAGTAGGAGMVYIYSYGSPSAAACISCRQDGRPTAVKPGFVALLAPRNAARPAQLVQPITVTADGQRAFFYSRDPLALGAIEGLRNLYEWHQGQVTLLAVEPVGVNGAVEAGNVGANPTEHFFIGASPDGGDVYLASPLRLSGEDGDSSWDVYDARVGGGFPSAGPAAPCDPLLEGACQPGIPATGQGSSPATATFNGPGNPAPKHKAGKKKRHKHKRGHHRKKGKHRTKGQKKKNGGKHGKSHQRRAQQTSNDRRHG